MMIQVAPRHARNFIQALKLAGVSGGLTMGAVVAKGDRILFGTTFLEYLTEDITPALWVVDNAPVDWIKTTLYLARLDHEGRGLPSRPKEIVFDELREKGALGVVFYSERLNVVRQKL